MTPIPIRNLTNSKSSNNGDCRLWGYLLFQLSAKFIYICDHFSFPSPFLVTTLFIPIGVLTHKKSFVLKKSYTKVFNPKESNFDLDTCMGLEPKLIFFFNGKNFQWSGIPIKLLTQKNIFVSLQILKRVLGQLISNFQWLTLVLDRF